MLRSSVFMADMTYIALRSKYNRNTWFKFGLNFLFDFWIVEVYYSFGMTIADCNMEIKREVETRPRQKAEGEETRSVIIFAKRDR